jgi:hypothetical protein
MKPMEGAKAKFPAVNHVQFNDIPIFLKELTHLTLFCSI